VARVTAAAGLSKQPSYGAIVIPVAAAMVFGAVGVAI
jgi:hypothetical protein